MKAIAALPTDGPNRLDPSHVLLSLALAEAADAARALHERTDALTRWMGSLAVKSVEERGPESTDTCGLTL